MPPKKPGGPSKKAEVKKQDKIIEDKTFGLKNKKGTKQQKFVKQVESQVKNKGQSTQKLMDDVYAKRKAKDKEDELDLERILRPVAAGGTAKVDKNVDPKSVLCMFYKQGLCQKGAKCKFSHDLSIEFKAQKRNVYVDERDNEENMDNWDEAKLNEVVDQKHGESNKAKPKTAIKRNVYVDERDNDENMDNWDEAKLNGVVDQKHGESNKAKPKTAIVSCC